MNIKLWSRGVYMSIFVTLVMLTKQALKGTDKFVPVHWTKVQFICKF